MRNRVAHLGAIVGITIVTRIRMTEYNMEVSVTDTTATNSCGSVKAITVLKPSTVDGLLEETERIANGTESRDIWKWPSWSAAIDDNNATVIVNNNTVTVVSKEADRYPFCLYEIERVIVFRKIS